MNVSNVDMSENVSHSGENHISKSFIDKKYYIKSPVHSDLEIDVEEVLTVTRTANVTIQDCVFQSNILAHVNSSFATITVSDFDILKFDRITVVGNSCSFCKALGAYIKSDTTNELLDMYSLNFENNTCINECAWGALYSSVPLSIKNSTFK